MKIHSSPLTLTPALPLLAPFLFDKIRIKIVGYLAGGKNCRRCEYYFFTERLFCECCGMRLRASPANREYKEKVRAKKRSVIV